MALRRDFDLLDEDRKFLDDYGLNWETITDGSQWVLIHTFPTHRAYNYSQATIAMRLETGYPNAGLDMVYVYPSLVRNDGKEIAATNATQQINGTEFQRWSRHRTPANPWKPGEDNLGSHVILIESWFEREFLK